MEQEGGEDEQADVRSAGLGVAGEATDNADELDESEEGLRAKPVWQPIQPTKKEIQEHELTHIPYRSWCVHCVKARARSNPHRDANTEEETDK